MKIVGRENEIKELDNYFKSGKSEFIVVYGRRRVGKTFLIREFFNNDFTFAHTGLANTQTSIQLTEFNKSLKRYRGNAQKDATD